ncbi:MAG: GDP-mannose 4,6-dehydratase [Bacteroidales bacterium]|nr:GDP-mannose 4,6-dehydratase [Bacteroidales bacterium]
MINRKKVLITGGAGFIGSHLTDRLIEDNWELTVIDNFDPFYDPEIKKRNISAHINNPKICFFDFDIRDYKLIIEKIKGDFDIIIHLAAKAGVRPSIADPMGYQDVNVRGTHNMLELARYWKIKHFIFASSSSVYGINNELPWKEETCVLKPISPYASTKISGELLGHVYTQLFGIRFIALRFFTVYGPRQRPDLAIHKFTKKIMNNEPIPFFGDGSSMRDYTYINDIVQGIINAINYNRSQFEIFNLGNDHTVTLSEMVSLLEKVLNKKAIIDKQPEIKGDVPKTWANIDKARALLNYNPKTDFELGLNKFADWFFSLEK